jgi:hypothetical protein
MIRRIIAVGLVAALLAVVEMALAQQPVPRPDPRPQQQDPVARDLTGTVKKVDPAGRTVHVSSGRLGIFSTTLMVTDDTRIQVQGRDGALTDIQEGANVKASYEIRDGRSVAKSLDVTLAPAPASKPSPSSPPATKPQ